MSHISPESHFEPDISLTTPLQDYKKLIEEKMQGVGIIDDDILQENYAKISAKIRDVIWKLLFMENPAKMENLLKAADCLREHKMDACFYAPWEYNEWIPKVRDELLRRRMIDFWRDQIVKSELGPCWAKDSDFFDNFEDTEPAEFYDFAGCIAPFVMEDTTFGDSGRDSPRTVPTIPSGSSNLSSSSAILTDHKVPEKIGLETPDVDYVAKLKHAFAIDPEGKSESNRVFEEVRQIIWQLLFDSDSLLPDNYSKAAKTLEAYKRDACMFNPFGYNDWIVKVRDELLARKYFDFWQNIICEKQLGLCWFKDSDYFDDMEDTAPIEFYEHGIKYMHESAK